MGGDILVLVGVLTLGLLSPGPDFLLVVKNSLAGWRAGAASAAGIALGLVGHMALVLGGFAALDAAGRDEALLVLRWAGAAVLVVLGVRAWRGAARLAEAAPDRPSSLHGPFLEGLLCNLTNAKALVFFVALFGRLLPPDPAPALAATYGAVVVLHAWFCWSAIAAAVQWPPVLAALRRHQTLLLRGFGVVLVLLGASLVAAG